MFACGYVGEGYARFNPDFDLPCAVLDVDVKFSGSGSIRELAVKFTVDGDRKERVFKSSDEKELLSNFLSLIEEIDPDIILVDGADVLMESIIAKSRNLHNPITRSGRFRELASKSYHSYGRARYREKALLPEGRILIDKSSFNFREGGLRGIILASRLTGLSPNLTARFTPGTLVSSYEVYEALRHGIAVPFRKSDAEGQKSFRELKKVDRGGMIFQPEPGFYENVFQLDFISMYPSIIVKYNLSPETVLNSQAGLQAHSRMGFLPAVLKPLLELRVKTKKLKKVDTEYTGIDSILKWMLVTCFGYTGYRNAKFGRIEVHESINKFGREILLKTKGLAEDSGFEVIHGVVDCLWLKKRGSYDIYTLKREVEKETGLLTEIEHYDWMVFLLMRDGFGAYNRYYGRLENGKMRLRGVAARRRNVPGFIKEMQLKIFDVLSRARNGCEIERLRDRVEEIYIRCRENLRDAELGQLVIRKVIGKRDYRKRCPEARLLSYCRKKGMNIHPGIEVGYVVLDSRRWIVLPEWKIGYLESPETGCIHDVKYYQKLVDRAWQEISPVFGWIR